jgi:rod shape determining protein RodA
VILILRQPALGMAMLFLPTLLVMLFVAGAKARHLVTVLGMGLAVLPLLWLLGSSAPGIGRVPLFFKPYQWQRVKAMFVHDQASMQSTGFQSEEALIAYSSGGFWGKGVGHIPVGAHVPEAHNDMIYALIGEQLGFFGSALLLMTYLVLFAAGTEIAAATQEPFGRLVAIGTVSMLAGQTFLNLLVTTHLMPVTGITLPFVSYGGSSMLASFIAAGLLLNIGQNRPLIIGKDSFEFQET